jgi:putative sigma-54 modulation protein
VTHQEEIKAPFAEHTSKQDKRLAGRTDATHTQVEIRTGGNDVDPSLREWIYDRLGRQLGKYATQIERIQVRFGDENGAKGGVDKSCLVHVSLSKLPAVVIEVRAESEREAFDLAAGRAERATRRTMEKHGFSTHLHQHREQAKELDAASEERVEAAPESEPINPGGLLGRYRPESMEGMVAWELGAKDTSQPGVAADDIKPGIDHTAMRNAKQNTAGMPYRLEDSTNGKPSRKSTRAGANRIKPANPLTQRTKAAVRSPKSNAARAAARGT